MGDTLDIDVVLEGTETLVGMGVNPLLALGIFLAIGVFFVPVKKKKLSPKSKAAQIGNGIVSRSAGGQALKVAFKLLKGLF